MIYNSVCRTLHIIAGKRLNEALTVNIFPNRRESIRIKLYLYFTSIIFYRADIRAILDVAKVSFFLGANYRVWTILRETFKICKHAVEKLQEIKLQTYAQLEGTRGSFENSSRRRFYAIAHDILRKSPGLWD